MKKVKIIGMGYVGQTLAAVMAESGLEVYGVDNSDDVVSAMKNLQSHVHEPGLNELLAKHMGKTLFVGKWGEISNDVDAVIISVPTPITKNRKPDTSYIESVLALCARQLKKDQLVVLRSTVPIGATRSVAKPLLEKSGLKAGKDFYLAFAPERTIQGAALRELTILPQIIGGINNESVEKASELFAQITPTIVPVSSPEAAETIKLIDNSFRDFKFAYANEIAELCEKTGLNAFEIIRAANRGYQRNNVPLPSPGVGGGCLSKDPHIFADSAAHFGQDLKLVKQSREVNEEAPRRVAQRLKKLNLKNKTVAVFGFAFKGVPPTNDVRVSPTLEVVAELIQTGASIRGFDHVVERQKIEAIGAKYAQSIEEALNKADVAVFMTNNKEFFDPEVAKLLGKMNKNGVVFDGWGIFDKKQVETLGLRYMGVGVGT